MGGEFASFASFLTGHGDQLVGLGGWSLAISLFVMLIRQRNINRGYDNAEDKQRAELGLAMLERAGKEIERLNGQLDDARTFTEVRAHLDEARTHLQALITSDPDEFEFAKRAALAFLKRLDRVDEARGVIRNEVQRAVSKVRNKGEKQ